MEILMNKYQTPITEELISQYPEEVIEQLYDCINNVPFIKNLTSPNRPYAKDLPRDENNRIIVNLTNPHIIEDADFFRQPALHYMKHGCYTFLKPNSNPNSEFRKFWDEEIRRCYEGHVRHSDGEWVTGYCYWFLNYCPMMVNKLIEGTKKAIRTESFPFFFEGIYWRFHYLHQAREAGNHAIELAKRGAGKAHPYNEKVFTPDGWKLWEDINIGDTLFDDNGGITKVIDIPFNDYCDIYEVTLRDGRKVKCSEGHLWDIEIHNRKGIHTMSTKEIMDIYKRQRKVSDRNPNGIELLCAIPRNKGIDMPFKETKVDPYTFGLLLGDGSFRHQSCYLTQLPEDLEIERPFIPYNIISWKDKFAWRIDIPNWGNILREYGLYFKKSEDKFIPDEYKYNSREVRLNVLKGLMDSDGTLDKKGRYIISLVSKQMIDDIAFICRSLGYNCSTIVRNAGYKKNGVYIKCLPCYSLTIYTRDKIANLPRKIKEDSIITNEYTINRELRTKITDIKYIGRELAKCVTVDNDNHRYLIGDFITTHNSYGLASIMSHNLILGENEDSKKRVITVLTAYQKEYLSDSKDGTLSKFKPEINFVFSNTPFPRLMLKNSPNEMTWQMGYKDEYGIERGSLNQVMAVSAKDDSEKLRGKRGWILFEEMGCHLKGTEVLMYNNTFKKVENIQNGDLLMGIDSTPRIVNNVHSGIDQMYKITLSNGDWHIVNSKHLVHFKRHLWNKNTDEYLNIPVENLYKWKDLQGCYIQKANIVYPHKEVKIDPYLLGLWLGDGDSNYISIANEDKEVLDWLLENYNGHLIDLKQSETCKVFYVKTKEVLYDDFRYYNLFGNKHIPLDYIYNAPEIGLQLLAGLIDADGNLSLKRHSKCFEITQRYDRKHILDAAKAIATNLGLRCTMSTRLSTGKKAGVLHYRLRISGDIAIIPTKIKRKKAPKLEVKYKTRRNWNDYTFKIEPYKEDIYYGFEVDKDNLFILKDGTITHNSFKGLLSLYDITRKSVEDGDYTFAMMYLIGTAAEDESDFSSAKTLLYNPEGYNIYHIENVFDRSNRGKKNFGFFFPSYINRAGCYNKDGVSDVVKALLEILMFRHKAKYSADPKSVLRLIAEDPITPEEAIIKVKAAYFPVTALNERLSQIDTDPNILNNSYVGSLTMTSSGEVKYVPTSDEPIRKYGVSNNTRGAIEIFQMPEKNIKGEIIRDRYIVGHDPVDNDQAESSSLSSTFVLDLFTDTIVAEYTGRHEYSEDNYEVCRLLCLFYNAKCLYESNKKGLFAYFSKMNCTHLLADTPEYLRDKQLVKYSSFGSNSKGVNASAAINNYANERIREWLLKPVITQVVEDGVPKEVTMPNLFTIKSRALLEELIAYTPELNVDRIRALGMAMLYREEKMILFQNKVTEDRYKDSSYLGNDDFFNRNYRRRQ